MHSSFYLVNRDFLEPELTEGVVIADTPAGKTHSHVRMRWKVDRAGVPAEQRE
jgi:hypothetical protein